MRQLRVNNEDQPGIVELRLVDTYEEDAIGGYGTAVDSCFAGW